MAPRDPAETMVIERDVPITMDDGLVIRADVYRPKTKGRVPVIMTSGPYGKGVKYQEHYKLMWDWLVEQHPDILAGSTRSFLAWETVDPEIWVPWGYAVIRVDSRGAGRSPGYLDIFSPRETRDYYNAIEWAGTCPWSNGKVGLNGISYYAINQWHVAALQPPHLTAMVPWEGATGNRLQIAAVTPAWTSSGLHPMPARIRYIPGELRRLYFSLTATQSTA
jgi:putative CocE/NonD family hydrolase